MLIMRSRSSAGICRTDEGRPPIWWKTLRIAFSPHGPHSVQPNGVRTPGTASEAFVVVQYRSGRDRWCRTLDFDGKLTLL
jgi:hypothetical protein